MTLHYFLQYLNYRRKAKGRHGTHSPFVYAFVADCIEKDRQQPLAGRIDHYFKNWKIIHLNNNPADWRDGVQSSLRRMNERQLFIVPGIHKTRNETQSWSALCQLSTIDYSMDLFAFGLLFVNKDFKEKQHFILKH